jgi:hypothetical protein
MKQELFTENKYMQIVLPDYEYQRLQNKLNEDDSVPFGCDRTSRVLEANVIEIPRRNFDLQINYIQKIYDNNVLNKKINELEQTIKKKDEELDRLRFDKTAALREFVEELRKEPLQVVLRNDEAKE